MIALMAVVFALLFIWLIPETIGLFDPATEDTFSEWVFDLALFPVVVISVLFIITGGTFLWAGGHFLEGYKRRRRAEERMDKRMAEMKSPPPKKDS